MTADSARNDDAATPAGPKSLADRRVDLERRRRIRAIELLRGSLLGTRVDLGTDKRPNVVTLPAAHVPVLADLVGLIVVYGTGFPVGDGPTIVDRPVGASLISALESARVAVRTEDLATRTRLWARVREPIARALRIVGTVKAEYVADLAAQAEAICGVCGLDWQGAFLHPAVESLPEPRSWSARKAS